MIQESQKWFKYKNEANLITAFVLRLHLTVTTHVLRRLSSMGFQIGKFRLSLKVNSVKVPQTHHLRPENVMHVKHLCHTFQKLSDCFTLCA